MSQQDCVLHTISDERCHQNNFQSDLTESASSKQAQSAYKHEQAAKFGVGYNQWHDINDSKVKVNKLVKHNY